MPAARPIPHSMLWLDNPLLDCLGLPLVHQLYSFTHNSGVPMLRWLLVAADEVRDGC